MVFSCLSLILLQWRVINCEWRLHRTTAAESKRCFTATMTTKRTESKNRNTEDDHGLFTRCHSELCGSLLAVRTSQWPHATQLK
uniref:Putative secreted protein n=1 Tax=Anopheles darlingi TaxID=43151 RepID=A0A2M4D5W2_ANODA